MRSHNSQTFGFDANGNKVIGEDCRERGAIGMLFHEYEEYDAVRKQWVTVMHPLNASGFRVNKFRAA